MQALLAQMQRASQFRGNRTLGEAALRMGTQFLNKRRYDKMAEAEKADEARLADALTDNRMVGTPGSGTVTSTPGEAIAGDTGEPFTITKKERGTAPGKAINENALAEILSLPTGLREQGLAALQAVQSMQPKQKEAEWGTK